MHESVCACVRVCAGVCVCVSAYVCGVCVYEYVGGSMCTCMRVRIR